MKKNWMLIMMLLWGVQVAIAQGSGGGWQQQPIPERVEAMLEQASQLIEMTPEQMEGFAQIYEDFYTAIDSARSQMQQGGRGNRGGGGGDRSGFQGIMEAKAKKLETLLGKEKADKVAEMERQIMEKRREQMRQQWNQN